MTNCWVGEWRCCQFASREFIPLFSPLDADQTNEQQQSDLNYFDNAEQPLMENAQKWVESYTCSDYFHHNPLIVVHCQPFLSCLNVVGFGFPENLPAPVKLLSHE